MSLKKKLGFTLVELVMVIVVTGILAAIMTVFLKPAIDSYFDTRRRADLTDIADTALRRMAKDIRGAVPNSIRSVSSACFQLVPTTAGGRYRMAPDTVTPGSSHIDTGVATDAFDVLSPLSQIPVSGDWVVIDNQNGADVYAGANRGQVSAVTTPATGLHRIALSSATQFPIGYDGGRFVLVSNAEQTVFYHCAGNVLYRSVTDFTVSACPSSGGSVVATDVAGCTFVYDPNQGATQQSGFVWLQLQLSRSGESVTLAHGVHVDNVP